MTLEGNEDIEVALEHVEPFATQRIAEVRRLRKERLSKGHLIAARYDRELESRDGGGVHCGVVMQVLAASELGNNALQPVQLRRQQPDC